MRVLALDLSTSTGFSVLDGDVGKIPTIVEYGQICTPYPAHEFGEFPWGISRACHYITVEVLKLIDRVKPDKIVVEAVNRPGRFTSRFSQFLLDGIHALLLREQDIRQQHNWFYIDTSSWRKATCGNLTKADKTLNAKVARLKKAGNKKALSELGVRGKISRKHVSIRWVNETFKTNFKPKDEDLCESICQGAAFFLGAKLSEWN